MTDIYQVDYESIRSSREAIQSFKPLAEYFSVQSV